MVLAVSSCAAGSQQAGEHPGETTTAGTAGFAYLPVDKQTISGAIPKLTVNGAEIPVLSAEWNKIDGTVVGPPATEMVWPKVNPGPMQVSMETRAVPVTLDLNFFDSVGSNGIPDESEMQSESCVRFDTTEEPSTAACIFGVDEDGWIRVYIPSPSPYVVIAATWYPKIGSEAENMTAEVGATWGVASQAS
ncbi:hypothetical protein ACYAFX_28490 (plasmid) [Rhodococcus aetherivorans]